VHDVGLLGIEAGQFLPAVLRNAVHEREEDL
jgi:hypothetical protein